MELKQLKNEILKNGGITLVNDKKMEYKSGYIISLEGYEYTTTDLDKAINKLMEYKKSNKIVGCWNDNGLYYVDINFYFNKNDHKKAVEIGKKNKQLAIFNIATGSSEYIQNEYFILYKYNKIKNDFTYIKEFTKIDNIKEFLQVKTSTIYKNMYKSIDNIKTFLNKNGNNYIIVKELDNIEY